MLRGMVSVSVDRSLPRPAGYPRVRFLPVVGKAVLRTRAGPGEMTAPGPGEVADTDAMTVVAVIVAMAAWRLRRSRRGSPGFLAETPAGFCPVGCESGRGRHGSARQGALASGTSRLGGGRKAG